MELIKFFVESVIEIIHYLAWPVTILTIILICLILFYKEFKHLIKRIKKASFRNITIECSETQEDEIEKLPVPEIDAKPKVPADLTEEAKRILATLWMGQTRHFKGISEGQWSFRILPSVYQYGNFIVGFAELLKSGFIGWECKNGQAVLTKKGFEFIKENREIREFKDVYMF